MSNSLRVPKRSRWSGRPASSRGSPRVGEEDTELLLKDIEADAASLSVENTASLNSTVHGLGTVSGRAIMAIGEFILYAIEVLNIRLRLRGIKRQLRRERPDIPTQLVEDLLELQRVGLYPAGVRRRASKLIMLVMSHRRAHTLFVNSLEKHPTDEIRLFLRQLCAHSMCPRICDRIISAVCEERALLLEKRITPVEDCFRAIILTILPVDFSILRYDFDFGQVWSVIVRLMEERETEWVSNLTWSIAETIEFLQKLQYLRACRWNVIVARAPSTAYRASHTPNLVYQFSNAEDVTEGFCDIVFTILKRYPSIMQQNVTTVISAETLTVLGQRGYLTLKVGSLVEL